MQKSAMKGQNAKEKKTQSEAGTAHQPAKEAPSPMTDAPTKESTQK